MRTFLDILSEELLKEHSNNLQNITLVLPNKRARLFFKKELAAKITTPIFVPKIMSIEDWMLQIAGTKKIDNTELLFEF